MLYVYISQSKISMNMYFKMLIFIVMNRKSNLQGEILQVDMCFPAVSDSLPFKPDKKRRGNNVGLCVKVEPAASATEQINLKRNPMHLLPTSTAMEITENYCKMRTRPLRRSDHTWECYDISSPHVHAAIAAAASWQ